MRLERRGSVRGWTAVPGPGRSAFGPTPGGGGGGGGIKVGRVAPKQGSARLVSRTSVFRGRGVGALRRQRKAVGRLNFRCVRDGCGSGHREPFGICWHGCPLRAFEEPKSTFWRGSGGPRSPEGQIGGVLSGGDLWAGPRVGWAGAEGEWGWGTSRCSRESAWPGAVGNLCTRGTSCRQRGARKAIL